jgi:hypothetical protein
VVDEVGYIRLVEYVQAPRLSRLSVLRVPVA